MNQVLRILLTGCCLSVLAACATKPCGNSLNYQDARPGVPLQVPASLNHPQPDPSYVIPDAGKAPANAIPCLAKPPEIVKPNGGSDAKS